MSTAEPGTNRASPDETSRQVADRQDRERSENEGMRGTEFTSAETRTWALAREDRASTHERDTPDPVAPNPDRDLQSPAEEWVPRLNHRLGQSWEGGPRPMDAAAPEPAAPSRSRMFERDDAKYREQQAGQPSTSSD
jgi:hypothetical protein